MKIVSTVCEVQENKEGELILKEIEPFDTREEAVERIQELLRKNKSENRSYTIVEEFIIP